MMNVRAQVLVAVVVVAVTLAAIAGVLIAREQGAVLQNQETLAASRAQVIAEFCLTDVQQDDVLRAILLASIRQREITERRGGTSRDNLSVEEARALSDRLMRPLGGLEPTEKQKRDRCAKRVERATP